MSSCESSTVTDMDAKDTLHNPFASTKCNVEFLTADELMVYLQTGATDVFARYPIMKLNAVDQGAIASPTPIALASSVINNTTTTHISTPLTETSQKGAVEEAKKANWNVDKDFKCCCTLPTPTGHNRTITFQNAFAWDCKCGQYTYDRGTDIIYSRGPSVRPYGPSVWTPVVFS